MPLAGSGTISIGGSTATRSINLELGRAASATSSLNETSLRSLAGVASGAISLSNFFGKSSLSYVSTLGFDGSTFSDSETEIGSSLSFFQIRSDGTWYIEISSLPESWEGNWVTPTTAGVGTGKYVRFTVQSTNGSSAQTFWTATTAWLELSSNRTVTVSAESTGLTRSRSTTYLAQIATDSGGSNIVSSGTATLTATALYNGGM